MNTQVSRHLAAPRSRVYEALITPGDIARWRFPVGMTCMVHEFDPVEGGKLRVSLTYDSPERAGKTGGQTDTYRGRFVKLVPNELVVEAHEFETTDSAFAGEMTMTIRLSDADDGGTELIATHHGLPSGLSPAANEAGWREALSRLAHLVERSPSTQ